MSYDLTNRKLHTSNMDGIELDYYQQKESWLKELSDRGIKAFHCGNGISDTPGEIHRGFEPTGSPSLLADIVQGDKVALGWHGKYRLVTVTESKMGFCGVSIHYKEG